MSLAIHKAYSEDTDKTESSLGAHVILLVLPCGGSSARETSWPSLTRMWRVFSPCDVGTLA